MPDQRNTSAGSPAPYAASALERLTPRQREIIELVARGLTNDDVATALAISPTTVRTHLTAIMARLEVTNRTEATALVLREDTRAATMREVMRRPMIAVLPFATLDGDVRTRSFALGLSYDLSSLFARWCWFPVVSSAATVGARLLGDARAIAKRLGCRFVVDGSIRVADVLELEVRIDDAERGTRVWSERYTCSLEAFFRTQAAICAEIVASAYPMLIARSYATERDVPSYDLSAWERAHEGMRMQSAREADANRAARAHLVAARELAPDLVLAHYGLGLASYDAALNQWAPPDEARAELLRCATTTIGLAPHAAEGFFLLARHHFTLGEVEEARVALVAAVSRNPSFAVGHALLAQAQQLRGESDAALESMQIAMRLSPRSFVAGLAALHFVREEYDLALATSERCIASNAGYLFAYLVAAASAHYLGDDARARVHVETLRAAHPTFDEASLLATFGADLEAFERLVRAVRAVER